MTKREREDIRANAAQWRAHVFESFRQEGSPAPQQQANERIPPAAYKAEDERDVSGGKRGCFADRDDDQWLSGIRVASAHLSLLEECVRMNAARNAAEAASLMIKLGLRANERIIALHAEQRAQLEQTRKQFAGIIDADAFD